MKPGPADPWQSSCSPTGRPCEGTWPLLYLQTSHMRNVVLAIAFVVSVGFGARVEGAVCDLTVAGSTCSSFGGVIYTNVLPTGTVYIDPFLQLKTSMGGTSEKGYNTSGDTDTSKSGQQFQSGYNQTGTSRSLSTSELTTTTVGGTSYYEFWLNSDEPGGDPKLSLDQLQIFFSPTNTNPTSYDSVTRTLGGLTSVYDLDSGGNNTSNLNYSPQPGRTGTMIAYVPTSLFTQPGYIYLYSQFGTGGYLAGGGMEEWWIRTSDTSKTAVTNVPNPEPGTLVLVGSALALGVRRLRKKRISATA